MSILTWTLPDGMGIRYSRPQGFRIERRFRSGTSERVFQLWRINDDGSWDLLLGGERFQKCKEVAEACLPKCGLCDEPNGNGMPVCDHCQKHVAPRLAE